VRERVLCGLDRIGEADKLLRGARLGLMTHPAAINQKLCCSIDVLHNHYHLSSLFGCEHGVRGALQAGEHVDTYEDPDTGVPVYSLYGKTLRMTKEMLDSFDVLVFDMQDVGARFYTYLYSLSYALQACDTADKRVVLLDRINPVGGQAVQGTILDEAFHSFVGEYAMPVRYGLTIGEYAGWVRHYLNLHVDLHIVPLKNWRRSLYLDDISSPWAAPSPNCPTIASMLTFLGTCVFEGTNLSEGRGTTNPFELVGAPWVDGTRLALELNRSELPGVGFRSTCFTPTFSKHQGVQCQGVQMHITDRHHADTFSAGLMLLEAVRRLYPDCFQWLHDEHGFHADRILGSDDFRLERLDAKGLIEKHRPLLDDFIKQKKTFELYK